MALQIGDLSPGETHFWEGVWQWQRLWLRPDQVLEAVTSAFGRVATEAKYLASGMLNQSWRIDGRYVLRVSRSERTRAQVQYEHDVINALHERLDLVVPALAAQNGETVVDWNGHVLSLFPFVHGISGADVDKATRTLESAAVLARIHCRSQALDQLGQRPGSRMFDEGDRWPWSEQKRTLDKGFAGNSEAEQLIATIDAEYAELGRWLDGLTNRNLPRAIVHGDFNSRNLIFSEGKIVAVIDWDNCRRDALAFEVGVTHDSDEFVAAYLDAGGPLAPADDDLLAGFSRIGTLSEVQWAVEDGGLGRNALPILRDVVRTLQRTS